MKFGGAALKTVPHFAQAASLIAEKKGCRVVVVVSAMGELTGELLALAGQVSSSPPKRELDMLISVGERISSSLLAMALAECGVEAVSLTGSQSGIMTSSEHSAATIIAVRPIRVEQHLKEGKVVIVAGFQGVSGEKEITTLGRDGSDLSAVALALSLEAKWVEFYKDVRGVYRQDPKKYPNAELLERLSFEEALALDSFLLHRQSLVLAAERRLPLHILSYKKEERLCFPGTKIF